MLRFKATWIVGAAVLASTLGLSSLMAQPDRNPRPDETPGLDKDKTKQVSLTGTIIDLHEFMTKDEMGGAKMPAVRGGAQPDEQIFALQSNRGLVILGAANGQMPGELTRGGGAGMGVDKTKSEVEVTGKLYEKEGIKYLEVVSVTDKDKNKEKDKDQNRHTRPTTP